MLMFFFADASMPTHFVTDSTSWASSSVRTTLDDSRSDLLPTMIIGGAYFDERDEWRQPHEPEPVRMTDVFGLLMLTGRRAVLEEPIVVKELALPLWCR